ncbi:hypothetical protein C9374_007994 [Naegleria lovaniensis]|uniref:Uncharacterized protein n=1 Tax=Naegleria lovaniensis TaxID=51637 RepID=A0AA88GLV7_NAELO|nr:uncharacterized protein C9374_007994 [Naegleria lovaniensis]KAG2378846.1 hypothetical protein C9374_007994 [Naegleria lovaniensis]
MPRKKSVVPSDPMLVDSAPSSSTVGAASEGMTLLESARRGDVALVKKLIESGLDVNLADDRFVYYGMTPLMWACDSGHVPVVNYLLSVPGININQLDGITGRTALHYAAIRNYKEICEILIKANIETSTKTILNHTAEDMAYLRGQHESLVVLK